MRWKLFVGIFVFVILAIIATVYVVLATYDYNKLKPWVARMVEDGTGRELGLGGEINLSFGLSPSLVVTDITLSNASWGSQPQMIKIGKLQAQARLFPLLFNELELKHIDLDGVEIGEALQAKDLKHAHSLVHNIKGLAGNLEATELQSAAIEMEKLVKGESPEVSSEKQLHQKYVDLKNAINDALESVQTLGVPAEEKISELPHEEIAEIPAELAEDMAKRLRDAAEMGDVTALNAIAEEIKNQSDSFVPLSEKIVQLAEDFEFDGILKMADELDAV